MRFRFDYVPSIADYVRNMLRASDSMNINLDVSFRSDGNSEQFTATGWGTPEPHGRWTAGPTSSIILSPVVPGWTYRVTLALRPYVDALHRPEQRLRIFCNDILSLQDTISEARVLSFELPADAVTASRKVHFRFEVLDCIAPASYSNSNDVRQLGFSVARLTVNAIAVASVSHVVRLSSPQQIAAVTMVYNEAVFLPIWLKHYGRQVGLENCFVIDHGSDDGSTRDLPTCNVIRIPRSPFDDHKKSAFSSQFCSSLLNWFDWVVYSDVDELLIADPKVSPSLREYVRRPLPDVVTAIGLNVAHRFQVEPELDLTRPVTSQRHYVFSASSMCKPNLICKPVKWSPGSHSSDAEVIFDHLYMFHLRWFDLPYGLKRLHKTRNMAWARTDGGVHQRVEDEKMSQFFRSWAELPAMPDVDLDPAFDPIKGFISAVLESQEGREKHTYKVSLDIWGRQLWRLPDRFVGLF